MADTFLRPQDCCRSDTVFTRCSWTHGCSRLYRTTRVEQAVNFYLITLFTKFRVRLLNPSFSHVPHITPGSQGFISSLKTLHNHHADDYFVAKLN
uniref:Uncharacterized protein n=1 Tax=Arundo donax TaxID=35708 RepID=A0A0A9E7G7_ARUDO